jgi:aryl-alcohol dehydrogenase-like predicted oxidoreductase
MRYRTIANSDVSVSEIGFGVWTVAAGWWGDYSDDEAITLLRQAFDRGITFFDTADTYGHGRGETILQQAFPGADRDDIVIGAKFGYDWKSRNPRDAGHREAPHRTDVPFLEQALEDSLRRLGTDRIDFYQLHNPRMPHLEDDALWSWVDRIKREGKARAVGVALGPAIGWAAEGRYALEHLPVDGVQMIYNALELDPGRELIEVAERTGKSLVIRVPHSSGMLEGKYTAETTFAENDHRRHRPRSWLIEGIQKVEQLQFLVEENGGTIGQAALRYVLRSPAAVSALPNIYDRDQVIEFAGAAGVPDITDEQARRIEHLYETNYGIVPAEETATEAAGATTT